MQTTTRLLDAAEKRMRKGGYNAVSFRDLAEDTNIKSSSVHYHFPKKEDLGSALVLRYAENFFTALEEEARNATTPSEKLDAYARVYRTALGDGTNCLCGLLGAEMGGLPDTLANHVRSFFEKNAGWLEDALPQTFSPEKRKKTAYALLAAHQGGMMLSASMKDHSLFDAISSTASKQALATG
ncbi:MAG: TetR/AcrR family transcriptional regulator [Pseudomonadota bacterium]